jgi:hypothetical protein
MFTLVNLPAETLDAYNKGRRDEQIAVENTLEFLVIKRQIHPDTLNLLIEHFSNIDRRPKAEI